MFYWIMQVVPYYFYWNTSKGRGKINDSGLAPSLFSKMCENEEVRLSEQVPAGTKANVGMHISYASKRHI